VKPPAPLLLDTHAALWWLLDSVELYEEIRSGV